MTTGLAVTSQPAAGRGIRRIYLSAGEPSGDLYLGKLAAELGSGEGTELVGMSGPVGRAAGVKALIQAESLTAMGFAELFRLPAHVAALGRTRRQVRADPCDVAVLIDYPGYHLRVARMLRRHRVPVLQYVAPQLWAWGARRIGAWRDAVNHCAAILPFEPAYFGPKGLPTTFVGHPLLDQVRGMDRGEARRALPLGDGTPALALFPGSRPQELARMWPVFRDAARRLRADVPDLEVVVATPDQGALGETAEFRVTTDAEVAMVAADAVLCKSGTSTLLATLCRTPMVVAYRAHPWSFAVARRLVTVPRISLVNLLANREVVPELIQDAATPERLSTGLLPLFREAATRDRQLDAFEEIAAQLGQPGVARRVAALAAELRHEGRGGP